MSAILDGTSRLGRSVPERMMSTVCAGCTKDPPRALPGPEVLIAIVTDRCNLRCPACNYWRERPSGEPLLSLSAHKELVHSLATTGLQRAVLTGGEPTVRRDWKPLLTTWAEAVPDVLLLTNGTRLDDDGVRHVSALSNVRLVLSWDGWELDAGPSSVGRAGMQETIWNSIGRLCAEPALEGRIGTNITITPHNMLELPEIATALAKRGVDFVHLHLVYSPDPDYRFTSNQCFELPIIVQEAVAELRSHGVTDIIDHVPHAFMQASRCYIPFSHCTIGPRGEVFGCIPAKGGFQDVSSNALGDLRSASFAQVWNSSAYTRFREDALGGKHDNCIACLACHAARNFASEPCRGCPDKPSFAASTPEFY